jgi:hypothetical protein
VAPGRRNLVAAVTVRSARTLDPPPRPRLGGVLQQRGVEAVSRLLPSPPFQSGLARADVRGEPAFAPVSSRALGFAGGRPT